MHAGRNRKVLHNDGVKYSDVPNTVAFTHMVLVFARRFKIRASAPLKTEFSGLNIGIFYSDE